MTDQTPAPGTEPTTEPARQCPWCAAPAAADATVCTACGAALEQRESIGGVRIAGLTAVDPALEDYDKRPLNIAGPSPTQGLAPTLIVGALAGGPMGLAAIGGIAAVAGAEWIASEHDGTDAQELADVGKPSEVLLQALEHERATDAGAAPAADGGAGGEADAGPEPDPAAADHGMSIWRDLPPEPGG
jgi:hypothetical protein